MLSYWSNVLGMLGVALLATAAFQKDAQALGYGALAGGTLIFLGAAIHSLKSRKRR